MWNPHVAVSTKTAAERCRCLQAAQSECPWAIGRERPSFEQGLKFSLLHLDVFGHRGCVRLWGTRRDCAGQYSAAAGYVNRAYQGMLTTLQKEQQTLVAFASLILVKRRVVRGALFSSTARMRRAEIARVTRHVSGRVQKLSLQERGRKVGSATMKLGRT